MGKKSHGSKHHITPTSRGGKETPENEMRLDPNIHDAWHTLFGNLLLEEVIAIIEYQWQDEFGEIPEKYILGDQRKEKKKKDKRISAWGKIFGEIRSAKKAINIIKANFIKRA